MSVELDGVVSLPLLCASVLAGDVQVSINSAQLSFLSGSVERADEPSNDLKRTLDELPAERSPFRLIGDMLAFDRLFDTLVFSFELEFEIVMVGTLNSFGESFGSCTGR